MVVLPLAGARDTERETRQLSDKDNPPVEPMSSIGARRAGMLGAEVMMEHRGSQPSPEPAPSLGASPVRGRADAEADAARSEWDDPLSIQILATEHWSLLATRSMSWNESFSRTGIFLSVLSASVVALGLVGGATGFDRAFAVFALALLPLTLFIGVATFVRLDEVNMEDVRWVAGMNRIRHGYLEARPRLEPYFTSGTTDDMIGIGRTFAMTQTPTKANTLVHQFVTTPGMVAVVNGVLAAATVGIALATVVGPDMVSTVPIALLIGVLVIAIQMWTSVRRGRRVIGAWVSRFPTPNAADADLDGYWGRPQVEPVADGARGVQQDR